MSKVLAYSILFRLKVHESEGSVYESLFSYVMKAKYGIEFTLVKPYGSDGDRKNDGCLLKKGIYYQVYAPEDIHNPKTYKRGITKLNIDFEGLKHHWGGYDIKEYYFTINDKYKGLPPDLVQAIEDLNKKTLNIEIDKFTSYELQQIFDSLTEIQKQNIVGNPPDMDDIVELDYSVLTEVIDHLMLNIVKFKNFSTWSDLKITEFNDKIKFNNLSPYISRLLNSASSYEGSLIEFLRSSNYKKESLQEVFSTFYKRAKKRTPFDQDTIFFSILEEALKEYKKEPNFNQAQNCILVLMAHFFESCDIFESKENTGAQC